MVSLALRRSRISSSPYDVEVEFGCTECRVELGWNHERQRCLKPAAGICGTWWSDGVTGASNERRA